MTMHVSQIPLSDWPLGLEEDAAFTLRHLRDLTADGEIAFTMGEDDLDIYDAAIVQLDDGTVFALQHYRNAPIDGTKIIVRKNDLHALSRAMMLLALDDADLAWIAPHFEAAGDAKTVKKRLRWRTRQAGSPTLYAKPLHRLGRTRVGSAHGRLSRRRLLRA